MPPERVYNEAELDFLEQARAYYKWLVEKRYITEAQGKAQYEAVNKKVNGLQQFAQGQWTQVGDYTGLPEYDKIASFARVQAQGQEPYLYTFNIPGSAPQSVVISKDSVESAKQYESAMAANATYQIEQAKRSTEAKAWEEKFGLRSSMTGGITSAATIAENQKLQERNVAEAQQQAELKAKWDRLNGLYNPTNDPNYQFARGDLTQGEQRAAREKAFQTPTTVPGLGQIPGQEQDVQKFVQGVSNENLRRYIAEEGISKLTQTPGILDARQAWWAALHPYNLAVDPNSPYLNVVSGEQRYGQARSAQLAVLGAAGVSANISEGWRTGQSSEWRGGEAPKDYIDQTKDPLAAAIERYPWYKEFMMKAPSQRGWNPERLAPRARWINA